MSQIVRRIVVDLGRQKLYAYEGKQANTLLFEFDCITGRSGKDTDLGKHRIFRKEHPYTSKKYKVPMDYAMFFTEDGKAIHQSRNVTLRSYAKALGIENLGASVGSHGCVGLAEADAKALYAATPLHTLVETVQGVG